MCVNIIADGEEVEVTKRWHNPPNFESLVRIPTNFRRFLPVHKCIIIHGFNCTHAYIYNIYYKCCVYYSIPEATCGQVALFVLCFSPVGSHNIRMCIIVANDTFFTI